jgi:hypothetical protein
MVCTCYYNVLWSPVLNKSATGGLVGQEADRWQARKPWGLYAANF